MSARPAGPSRAWLALVHAAAWVPAANLAGDFLTRGWPVNPIQALTYGTGLPALVFLVLALAVTPAISLTGWSGLAPLRRWLGLYAAAYAAVHVALFAVVDYGLDLSLIAEVLLEKRYLWAGLGAFVLLAALALTSTRGWQLRLGPAWKRLHRGAYLAGVLAVAHFIWLAKGDLTAPLCYGAVLGLLLLARLPGVRRRLAAARQWLPARLRRPAPAVRPPVEPGGR